MPPTLVRYWGSYFKHRRQSRRFATVFQRAATAGWRSYLVCCRKPDDLSLLDEVTDAGAKIVYLPRARGNFDTRVMRQAYRLCHQVRCDVFHCDNIDTSPLIGAAAARVPVRLWSKRSMTPGFELARKPTLRDRISISIHVCAWLATRTLSVSAAVKDELLAMGVPRSKLMVMHNPIDKRYLELPSRADARRELGYAGGQLVFATIGRSVPVKGWVRLVGAFAQVAEKFPHARLELMGGTKSWEEREHFPEVLDRIRAMKLEGRVNFTGYMSDIGCVLAGADVFVLPSLSEGYGIALLEAMTAGLACISTRVGAATDLIRNGENGLLVDRLNEPQMVRAMLKLAADAPLRERMGRRAASQKLAPTLDEYADRLVTLYKQLLAARTNDARTLTAPSETARWKGLHDHAG